MTGTDENSQKTVDAAQKLGEDVKAYTDRLAEVWRSTWQKLGITNTDFIRTTEKRHVDIVKEFWRRVDKAGDIYKGKYVGLYCKGHEAFLKESDLVNGLCPDHKTAPEKIEEENYFFRLSKYQKQLQDFYGNNPEFVTPGSRFNEVKAFVTEGLEDISISRATQEWGIPVPTDPKHVVYVWFDALINYMSAVGMQGWLEHPADVHFIGKDIVRFHAVIWPAMLLSASFPLPKQIATNGFFTTEGVKISKSLGNAIDPLTLVEKYGNDALRYFLFREIAYGSDGDFSEKKFIERYNGELANGLGNLVARVAALGEELSPISYSANIIKYIKVLKKAIHYDELMEQFKFNEVLLNIWDGIFGIPKSAIDALEWRESPQDNFKLYSASGGTASIYFINNFLTENSPWKIKDLDKRRQLLGETCFYIALITECIEPFLPTTAEKIKQQISFDREKKAWQIKKGESLFPRLEI